MKGRLNIFQAAMLRWKGMHPYNAVHVVAVDRTLDPAKLARDVDAQLQFMGLTGFELDLRHRRFEYKGGVSRASLQTIPAGQDAARAVHAEMERQLNLPFARNGAITAFRFFAVDAGPMFYLGVGYDHFIAGGDSIVVLLETIVARHTESRVAPADPPNLYPSTYLRLFARHAGAMLSGMLSLGGMIADSRRAARPNYGDGSDLRNALIQLRVEEARFALLVRVAKSWGVTRSELLIAVLLVALSPRSPERWSGRRREIAIGTIVNIRRDLEAPPARAFGQFLSSCRVSHPVPPGVAIREIAQDVHRQLTRIRDGKLYLHTLVPTAFVGVQWRFLSPARRARFYLKNYPLSAGFTPLNATVLWQQAGGGSPRIYLRAVSTGPLAPLVVAATKCGDALEIGITFRTSAFERADIARIADAVLQSIDSLEP